MPATQGTPLEPRAGHLFRSTLNWQAVRHELPTTIPNHVRFLPQSQALHNYPFREMIFNLQVVTQFLADVPEEVRWDIEQHGRDAHRLHCGA